MTKRKSIFQKASLFFGGVSLLLALASAVYLYLRVDELGRENPVAGSLLASPANGRRDDCRSHQIQCTPFPSENPHEPLDPDRQRRDPRQPW